MKKNVLKILLALVIVALVFALVACNNNDDPETPGTPSDPAKEDPKGNTNANLKKATAEDITTSLNAVGKGLNPYLNSFKAITANSAVGIDVAVGGYLSTEEVKGNFKLGVQGNLKKANPELKIGFNLNKTDKSAVGTEYVALGYKDGKLYLKQPLNLINAPDGTAPDGVEMDIAEYKDDINDLADFAMNALGAALASDGDLGKALANVDLEAIIGGLVGGEGEDSGAGFANILTRVLYLNTSNENDVHLVMQGKDIKTILGMVSTLVGEDNWTEIGNTVDTVLAKANEYVNFGIIDGNKLGIKEGSTALTFNKITSDYMPDIDIIAGFTSKEHTTLNAVKLGLNFTALGLELGLSIDLNTLSTTSPATVNFSGFDAKNLETGIDVVLGQNKAALDVVLNTAEGFANATNELVAATLKVGKSAANDYAGTVKASYNGQRIILSFADANAVAGTTQVFVEEFDFDLKEAIHSGIASLTGKDDQPANAPEDETAGEEEANPFASAFEKLFAMDFEGAIADALVAADEFVGPYLQFNITENGKARSLDAIWTDLKGIYDRGAGAKLTGSIKTTDTKAGIYLLGNNGNNLVGFILSYIKVPGVSDGEIDMEHLITANDVNAGLLEDYIELVFSLDDEDAATSYADWDEDIKAIFGIGADGFTTDIVEIVLGKTYQQICADGIFTYAYYNKNAGLDGGIGIANKDSGDDVYTYVDIRAFIGFKAKANAAVTAAATLNEGTVYPTIAVEKVPATDETEAEYGMNEDIFTAIKAALRYLFPVQVA